MTVYCYAAMRSAYYSPRVYMLPCQTPATKTTALMHFPIMSATICHVHLIHVMKSDIEGTDEAQEILPYQFEPEYTEEEILQLEAAGQGHGGGVEDRQQNTDWL